MSELKIFKDMEANCANCPFDITEGDIKRCYDDCGDKPNECYECSYLEYYLKSEADKVIAELKNEIEVQKRLRDMALASVPNVLKVMKIIQHQKYKRCLAMAKWCDEMMMSCELRGCSVHRIWANRHQWAMRWKYRWLELAEKFKEEK